MKARDAQRLRDALLVLGAMIMLAACLYEPIFGIGVIVAVSCVIPDFLFNKCPHCKKHLGRNRGRFCPHCGGEIS